MYSLLYYRFLNDQQGFLRVTSRKQVCQHITDFVFYVLVVISESPECLCFGIVRSDDYACLLSRCYAIDIYKHIGHSRRSIMRLAQSRARTASHADSSRL